MAKNYESMSVFEQIKAGLEESIAHVRGEINLPTTVLPEPPPPAKPQHVARLRKKLNMSQSVFAATLNVSPRTVQSWEQGLRTPNQASLRLIQVLEMDPNLIRLIFGGGKE
jgi:putative transcriptional regulator